MCNAAKHPDGCQCGFGPPYPQVQARIRKLLDWGDKRSSTVAELDVSFPLPKATLFHLVDETGKGRILKTTAEALQRVADNRFGKGNIEVVPIHVKKGSIEVGVILVAVAGAAYIFFKDYEALRKGVTLFTKDIAQMSSKLNHVVRRRYLREERRSLIKGESKSKENKQILKTKT